VRIDRYDFADIALKMMASNILSRLLPANPSTRSIYDDLRAHDEASESDIEERAGLALDEENLGYHDDELGNADDFNGEDSRMTTESTAFLGGRQPSQTQGAGARSNKTQRGHSKWLAQSPRLLEEDGDDDVPASLLIEGNEIPDTSSPVQARNRDGQAKRRQPAIPGPSTRETRAHWEAAQAQQRLHQDRERPADGPLEHPTTVGLLTSSPRDKAMWRWINVINLDNFIKDVYEYYTGSGIWCMVLSKSLDLL
jgi:autophagy-related protein 9